MAAVLVLLLGIAAAGVQYFDFVFQTVYEESTAHLAEVLHQSNNMLNEVVSVGDVVKVVVLEVDEKKKRISLSMKQAK